jgi:hypothetical protein
MNTLIRAGVMFSAFFVTPAFADEVWSCILDKLPHSKANNVYITQHKLWFAGATKTFSIIENNADHIVALSHNTIDNSSKDKIESTTTVILVRSSGMLTDIDDSKQFNFPDDDTPIIFHENCTQNK